MSAEDDIFDSVKFGSGEVPLSPSSLRAISSSSSYSHMLSPGVVVDEENRGSTEEEEAGAGLGGNRRRVETSHRSSAWQANYVNKMKKAGKGRKLDSAKMDYKSSKQTKGKKDRPLMQSGDAMVEGYSGSQIVNIKAKISDSGRVNIDLKADDSDDADLEEYLHEGSSDEDEFSEEDY